MAARGARPAAPRAALHPRPRAGGRPSPGPCLVLRAGRCPAPGGRGPLAAGGRARGWPGRPQRPAGGPPPWPGAPRARGAPGADLAALGSGQGQARRAPALAASGVRRPPVPGLEPGLAPLLPGVRTRPCQRRAGGAARPSTAPGRARPRGPRVPSHRLGFVAWTPGPSAVGGFLLGPARDGRAVLSVRLPTSWIARPAGGLLLGCGANGAGLLGREVGGFSAELGAAGIPESLVDGKVSFQLCHPPCRSGRQSRPEAALCAPLPASVRVPRSRRTERGNRPIEKCAQCQQTPCAQMRLGSLSAVSGEAV